MGRTPEEPREVRLRSLFNFPCRRHDSKPPIRLRKAAPSPGFRIYLRGRRKPDIRAPWSIGLHVRSPRPRRIVDRQAVIPAAAARAHEPAGPVAKLPMMAATLADRPRDIVALSHVPQMFTVDRGRQGNCGIPP